MTDAQASNPWVVVLAGGIGSRFWPASTPSRPKQLLPLADGRPLVAAAWERASAVASPQRVRLLAPPALGSALRVAAGNLPEEAVWSEPEAKGTAPALARAAWEIERRDPGALMVALHADHLIEPLGAFTATVLTALDVADRHDALVCVAVQADRPETGYGYIETGDELPTRSEVAAYRVCAFHEKPDSRTAAQYVRLGHMWNTGIFAWRASTFLDEVRAHRPDLGDLLGLLERDDGGVARFFAEAPSCVVDRAVLESSARVAAVRASFSWDDVGGWDALGRVSAPDGDGNFIHGAARVLDGSGNVVFADRGRVVVSGVDGLVVVRTAEATLVMPRDRAADLKGVLERIGERT